jgi:sodium-coupled neutral amino acid transporter 11
MVAYNVVIGDSFYLLFSGFPSNDHWSFRSWTILITHFILVLPICLIRDFTVFAKVSFMSLVSVAYLTIAVFVRSIMLFPDNPPTPHAWSFAHSGFFQSIAILSFGYVCHQNILQIYCSIRRIEKPRFTMATHVSILIALCFYALIGIPGYVAFTENTKGNILNNFSDNDKVIAVSRFALGLTMVFTYPLVTCVGREVSSIFFILELASNSYVFYF